MRSFERWKKLKNNFGSNVLEVQNGTVFCMGQTIWDGGSTSMYAYTLKILALSVRDCRDNCLAIQKYLFSFQPKAN